MDDLRAAPSMLGVCAAFLPAESAAFLPAAHRPPRPGRRLACSPIHNRREHIKMRAPRRGRLDDPPPDSWLITGPDRGGVVAARPPIDGYDTRQATNIEAAKVIGRGLMNTFTHVRQFPPADFRDVVRPNFETLYSVAWLGLTVEPIVLSVPDRKDRYYLLPMLDMWTDVFASPGKRTTGTGAGRFVIVPRTWQGKIPQGLERIDAPTPYVWIIGRPQTNGPKDYAAVNQVQNGYTLTRLSQLGKATEPVSVSVDPTVDMKTPR